MKQAYCRGMDPELFYPHRGDAPGIATAKEVCAQCEVRHECLEFGLYERHGVWGGFGERERRRLRVIRRLNAEAARVSEATRALSVNGRATETAPSAEERRRAALEKDRREWVWEAMG